MQLNNSALLVQKIFLDELPIESFTLVFKKKGVEFDFAVTPLAVLAKINELTKKIEKEGIKNIKIERNGDRIRVFVPTQDKLKFAARRAVHREIVTQDELISDK